MDVTKLKRFKIVYYGLALILLPIRLPLILIAILGEKANSLLDIIDTRVRMVLCMYRDILRGRYK